MGGTVYSSVSRGATVQSYSTQSTEQIFKSKSLNAYVNPLNLTVREARDSEAHPNTIPIIFALDVTGSMGRIPERIVRNDLTHLMEGLIGAGLVDSTICFCGIGDQYYDRGPLQVGQFESGDIELDKSLTSLWLERGGGGDRMESYLLAWLFGARHTSIDSWEKRGKKGYLFTVGDEWVHQEIADDTLRDVLGYKEASTIRMKDILKEAQEKYHVIHIHCTDGSYGSEVYTRWQELLGENCIITDSSNIVEQVIKRVLAIESSSTELTDSVSINNSESKNDFYEFK